MVRGECAEGGPEMTSQPTTGTLFEVIGADHITRRYFETGDAARKYAATISGAYVQIYLRPSIGVQRLEMTKL